MLRLLSWRVAASLLDSSIRKGKLLINTSVKLNQQSGLLFLNAPVLINSLLHNYHYFLSGKQSSNQNTSESKSGHPGLHFRFVINNYVIWANYLNALSLSSSSIREGVGLDHLQFGCSELRKGGAKGHHGSLWNTPGTAGQHYRCHVTLTGARLQSHVTVRKNEAQVTWFKSFV